MSTGGGTGTLLVQVPHDMGMGVGMGMGMQQPHQNPLQLGAAAEAANLIVTSKYDFMLTISHTADWSGICYHSLY